MQPAADPGFSFEGAQIGSWALGANPGFSCGLGAYSGFPCGFWRWTRDFHVQFYLQLSKLSTREWFGRSIMKNLVPPSDTSIYKGYTNANWPFCLC